jgi:hypothetical protein
MDVDLQQLRRQSIISALLTAIASILVLGSLFWSYRQTIAAEKKAEAILEDANQKKTALEADIKNLQAQKSAYQATLNATVTQEKLNSFLSENPSVASSIPRLFIEIADQSQQILAGKAAVALRGAGLTVPTPHIVPQANFPPKTELRFFYNDEQATKDVQQIQQILAGLSITANAQLVKLKPDQDPPPPRQYELWFGTSKAM